MTSIFSETTQAYKSKATLSTDIDQLIKEGLPSFSLHSVEASDDLEKERLAQLVRRLIIYVGQEGNLNDLEVWIKGLDDKKLIAFAEVNQGSLPFEISVFFLEDERKQIRDIIESNDPGTDMNLKQWVKKSRKDFNLSKKQVIEQGREAVVEILVDAYVSGRILADDERETIKNMALHIPDEKVIDNILIFAEEDRKIAIELSCNDALTPKHINRLVDIALGKAEEDVKWNNVINELMVHQHFKLEEGTKFDKEIIEKLLKCPGTSSFFRAEQTNTSVKSGHGSKRERKVRPQKKKIKRRRSKIRAHAKKESHWNELGRAHEEACLSD